MYNCPCCGFLTLPNKCPGSYEVCPVCAWVDDPKQYNDSGLSEGCNNVSLAEAMKNFMSFRAISRDEIPNVRLPKSCENPLYEQIRNTLPNYLPDSILTEAISLASVSPYEVAWTKKTVKDIISVLANTDISIAVVDVYKEEDGVISPAYINWSCSEIEMSTGHDSIATRTGKDVLIFLDSIRPMENTNYLYVLVFK